MIMIRSIVRPEKADNFLAALMEAGFPGVTKISVVGRGKQRVYLNQADPDDPDQRMFVESLDSGIDLNRRAGAEGSVAYGKRAASAAGGGTGAAGGTARVQFRPPAQAAGEFATFRLARQKDPHGILVLRRGPDDHVALRRSPLHELVPSRFVPPRSFSRARLSDRCGAPFWVFPEASA